MGTSRFFSPPTALRMSLMRLDSLMQHQKQTNSSSVAELSNVLRKADQIVLIYSEVFAPAKQQRQVTLFAGNFVVVM